VDWEQAIATGHIVAAVSALLAGAAVLLRPKGTRMHRRIGTVYVVALVLVNVAALSLHRANSFGVFHALAVASLVTLAVGLSPLLLGKRSETVIVTHAYCMAWSYAGLVAAGCGQLAVAVGQNLSAWVVPVVIGTMLTASGVIIFARVRRPSVGWLSDRNSGLPSPKGGHARVKPVTRRETYMAIGAQLLSPHDGARRSDSAGGTSRRG
jgi:uncharacterized membrane protein